MICTALEAARIEYHKSPATLYIWARVPGRMSSLDFARLLLERAGVMVAPGTGFGESGEGYFRLSITCPRDEIAVAAERIREVSRSWTT